MLKKVKCREKREKIYFPKSLQWYILSHLFKIYRQRLRWSRMINFDHLPATPWFFLINFFFLGTPFCHVQCHMLCHERGNAIYSQKLFTLFLKKQGKEFNFHLLLELGQMKSGKRTRWERRRKYNCIVSCSSVCTWKWGTLSRDFTYYYWLMQWSNTRVQWSNTRVLTLDHTTNSFLFDTLCHCMSWNNFLMCPEIRQVVWI